MKNKVQHPRPALFLLLAGIAGVCLWALHIYPIQILAEALAPDRQITSVSQTNMAYSQIVLSFLFIILSIVPAQLEKLWMRREHPCYQNLIHHAFFIPIVICIILTLNIQQHLLDRIPHVTDETSHLFQAKVFRGGSIYASRPPCYEHFQQHGLIMTENGRWFTRYPPGQAGLLTIGVFSHTPWLIVPIALAISLWQIMLIIQYFYNRTTAVLSGLLFALSPMALLLGGSYMSHVPFLMWASLGIYQCLRTLKQDINSGAIWILIFAGFCFGMSGLTRPHDLALLIPIIFIGVFISSKSLWKPLFIRGMWMLPGVLFPAAVYCAWQNYFYGSWLATGYGYNAPGALQHNFQIPYGFSNNFHIGDAIKYFLASMTLFNRSLLGWPISFIFIPFAFTTKRLDRRDILCLIASLTIMGFFFFWNYFAGEYEGRFYFVTIPFLIVLTIRGIGNLSNHIQTFKWRRLLTGSSSPLPLCITLAFIFYVHGGMTYWPRIIWPKYNGDYEESSPVIHNLAQKNNLENAIVLIDCSKSRFRYSAGIIYNDPLLSNNVIYARRLPNDNQCLKEFFPGRNIYRFIPENNWSDGRFEIADKLDRQL